MKFFPSGDDTRLCADRLVDVCRFLNMCRDPFVLRPVVSRDCKNAYILLYFQKVRFSFGSGMLLIPYVTSFVSCRSWPVYCTVFILHTASKGVPFHFLQQKCFAAKSRPIGDLPNAVKMPISKTKI